MSKETAEDRELRAELEAIGLAEAGPMVGPIPERWLAQPRFRCINFHVHVEVDTAEPGLSQPALGNRTDHRAGFGQPDCLELCAQLAVLRGLLGHVNEPNEGHPGPPLPFPVTQSRILGGWSS